jgi:hypothetical protein
VTGDEQWVDLRSAVAVTGVTRSQLAWAMAHGDVRYSTKLPGHLQTPMMLLADVECLASQLRAEVQRVVRIG